MGHRNAASTGGTAQDSLANLTSCGRPVRLETIRGGKPVRLGHDGKNATEEAISTTRRKR